MQPTGISINELVVVNQGDVFALEDTAVQNPDLATATPPGNQLLVKTNASPFNFAKEIQIVEDIGVLSAKSFSKLHPGSPAGTFSPDRKVVCTPISAANILSVCSYFYSPGVASRINIGAIANPTATSDVRILRLANNTYQLGIQVERGGIFGMPAGGTYKYFLTWRSNFATPTLDDIVTGLLNSLNNEPANQPLRQFISGSKNTSLGANFPYLQLTALNVGVNFNIIPNFQLGFGTPTLNTSGDTFYGLQYNPASSNTAAEGLDEIGGKDYMEQLAPQVFGYSTFTMTPGEPTQYIYPKKWLPNRKYGIIHIQHYKTQSTGGTTSPNQDTINLYIAFELSSTAASPFTAETDYVWGNGLITGAAFDGGIRANFVTGLDGAGRGTSLRGWLNAVNPAWIPETTSKIFGV